MSAVPFGICDPCTVNPPVVTSCDHFMSRRYVASIPPTGEFCAFACAGYEPFEWMGEVP